MAQEKPAQRVVWVASGLRRITLAFSILLLLPFYVSIGPMLFTRLKHGLLMDAFWLGLIGLCFTAIMALLVLQLVHAVRNRVVLDGETLQFTLPSVAGNIAGTAMFSKTIPIKDVRAVETREEIYGGSLAPVRVVATRIITREGEPVVLGFANPENTDQTFPFPKIGQMVAERAGVQVNASGAVRRSVSRRLLGHTGNNGGQDAVTPQELAAIQTRHGHAMRAVIAGFVLLMVGGIAVDLMTASRTSFAQLSSDAPEPKKQEPKKK
jgi:hypothetical protein